MTYQVLARKWRPRIFSELIGQQHVVRALHNSINNQKLHHAYLFTGTRGVGKTTIARVFSKSLNCELGPTVTPCLSCSTCVAIEEGRYVDLIEVDAASRTRVEDTKELLDNVQYLPSQGRYKIYLIDEIHMLSGHSFNALLKTLEEPPAHVIFLLATTDPQKIPVTVLSRCLQFTLKPLTVIEIATYLETVAKGEKVSFEPDALSLLAKSAKGSLRDSLSLLDQAIAYTSGNISYSMVLDMLGTVDDELIYQSLEAILSDNGEKILSLCHTMAINGSDFAQVLERFIDVLHQIAVLQSMPSKNDGEQLRYFAEKYNKEDIQLFYEICLKGLADIGTVPLASICFEMTLLRMMTFKLSKSLMLPVKQDEATIEPSIKSDSHQRTKSSPKIEPSPACDTKQAQPVIDNLSAEPAMVADTLIKPDMANTVSEPEKQPNNDLTWLEVIEQLSLVGMAKTVIMHCNLIEKTAQTVTLGLEANYQAMLTSTARANIEIALKKYWQYDFKLLFDVLDENASETPAAQKNRANEAELALAKTGLSTDPCFNEIIEQFDGKVDDSSIKLINQ